MSTGVVRQAFLSFVFLAVGCPSVANEFCDGLCQSGRALEQVTKDLRESRQRLDGIVRELQDMQQGSRR